MIEQNFLEGDVVNIKDQNDLFHYGSLPIHMISKRNRRGGIVLEGNYSKPMKQWSYLVEFGEESFWFLESELETE